MSNSKQKCQTSALWTQLLTDRAKVVPLFTGSIFLNTINLEAFLNKWMAYKFSANSVVLYNILQFLSMTLYWTHVKTHSLCSKMVWSSLNQISQQLLDDFIHVLQKSGHLSLISEATGMTFTPVFWSFFRQHHKTCTRNTLKKRFNLNMTADRYFLGLCKILHLIILHNVNIPVWSTLHKFSSHTTVSWELEDEIGIHL